jgi:hypothetical protein
MAMLFAVSGMNIINFADFIKSVLALGYVAAYGNDSIDARVPFVIGLLTNIVLMGLTGAFGPSAHFF